jgi:Cof subfamily protein (haloacid dehalogenase superfamily)
MRIRMVALDLDGTLLDPQGLLGDDVRDAVAKLSRAGLRVVVCTGRRFRTALPVVERLGLRGAIVVHNGALVKDIASGKTLQHAYLPTSLYPDVLTLVRAQGPPLVYVDSYHEGTDILTEGIARAHPYQREYLDDHEEHVREVEDLAAARPSEVIMLSTMGDEPSLGALSERAGRELGACVRTHRLINKNYRGQILEFLSPESGKWSALARLAASAGIEPAEIAAVGDDTNDVEMLARAGLGIAMGNAVPEARAAAQCVVASNAESGLVEAIERVLASA